MPNADPDPACAACQASESCAFTALGPEARARFHEIAESRYYAPGTVLSRQGERADSLYVVRSGLVRLLHLTVDGKEVGMRVITPGGMIGLTEVITGEPYHGTAQSVEDTRVDFIPRKLFVPFLLSTPKLSVELLIRISHELERLQAEAYEADGGSPMVQRLLHTLHDLARSCGVSIEGGMLLDLPLTVKDLARSLGCSRQWASKMLSEIEEGGLIERDGRRIVVTRAGLEADGSG